MTHRKTTYRPTSSLAFSLCLLFAAIPVCCARVPEPRDRLLWDYELPEPTYGSWTRIREDWMTKTFRPCLKAAGIELSCGGCIGVTIPVRIRIDSRGRLVTEDVQDGRICGELRHPQIERCFLAPLEQMQFPEDLHDREFLSRLGTGLKC